MDQRGGCLRAHPRTCYGLAPEPLSANGDTRLVGRPQAIALPWNCIPQIQSCEPQVGFPGPPAPTLPHHGDVAPFAPELLGARRRLVLWSEQGIFSLARMAQ